jgi:hypothetical protein
MVYYAGAWALASAGGGAILLRGMAGYGAAVQSLNAALTYNAHTLLAVTGATAAAGARMMQAASLLSQASMTAQDKVSTMLEFLNGIDFAISQEGVVDQGSSFLMRSENGRNAFEFIKSTGQILYGRLEGVGVNAHYVWSLVK